MSAQVYHAYMLLLMRSCSIMQYLLLLFCDKDGDTLVSYLYARLANLLQHQWALDNRGRNNSEEKDNAGGGVCLFTKILWLHFMYISLDTLDKTLLCRHVSPVMQTTFCGESGIQKSLLYELRDIYLKIVGLSCFCCLYIYSLLG